MTDQELLEQIQYAVVEPPDGGASWPSGLWTAAEVLEYCNQRQDRLLKETHLKTTVVALTGPLAGATTTTLPADWLGTQEVVWHDLADTLPYWVLHRADRFEIDHYGDVWGSTPATRPSVYAEYDDPTLVLRVAPPATVDSTLELRYVAQGTRLTGDGLSLTVPDDLAPCVKYGALAAMLGKDGRAQDLQRTAYCEQRYQLGVDLVRLMLEGGA